MQIHSHKLITLMLLLSTLCMNAYCASEPLNAEFFESKIRPLLNENCLACHGEKKQKGGLRLDSKKGWEKGGDTGPALIPGKSKDSLLIKMVQGTPGNPPQMPPDGVLPKEAIEALVTWINAGAPDPRENTSTAAKSIDWAAASKFWSFRPVTAVKPPDQPADAQPIDRFVAAKLRDAGLTPMPAADRRTLLRRATYDLTGLPPTEDELRAFASDTSPDAFAKVIDRLLSSPRYGEHQARAWLDLARYGEDQSDKEGKEGSIDHAWRYRDWTIEAFNKDLPYDTFTKLQIAADLLEDSKSDPADRRALGFIGLGAIYARPNDLDRKRAEEWDDRVDTLSRTFLGLTVSCARCHDHKYDPIPTQDYYSLTGVIANSKNTTLPISSKEKVAEYDAAKSKASAAEQTAKDFLQLEIDRIASEKSDSFPTYALACWSFNSKKLEKPALKADEFATSMKLDPRAFKSIDQYLRKGGGRSKKLEKWPDLLPKKDGAHEPGDDVKELAAEFLSIVKANLAKPFKQRNMDIQNDLFGADKGAFQLNEKNVLAQASDDWKKLYAPFQSTHKAALAAMPPEPPQCNGVADVEKPTDLKVYVRGNPSRHGEPAPRRFLRILAGADAPKFTRGSGRIDLAEAIANPTNPLTARVLANRIWQQHFSRGIVATPSNFGLVGDRPSHPELLDYLATRFISNGWSIKQLHREIMLSQTYQRASSSNAQNESIDPENKWLWRVSRRRLQVESFRDTILSVAGTLDLKMGGPSGELDDIKYVRRSIYGKVSRNDLSNLLKLFDFPAPNISAEKRADTTLPQQALFLLNSPFMIDQSRLFAARFSSESTAIAQVRNAYALAYLRAPSDNELDRAVKFLSIPEPTPDSSAKKIALPTRLERFAQALLAGNEMFYVD